eukprot:1427038-Rhodomonas_salina.3
MCWGCSPAGPTFDPLLAVVCYDLDDDDDDGRNGALKSARRTRLADDDAGGCFRWDTSLAPPCLTARLRSK